MKALLNSGVTEFVISLKFIRKHNFKRKKLKRLIYVRNMDSIFNYEEPIEHIVEMELFYKGDKKGMETDVIGDQK